jgi:hypothetical protein
MSYDKFSKEKLGDIYMHYNWSRPARKLNDSLNCIPIQPNKCIETHQLTINQSKSRREYKKLLQHKRIRNPKKDSKISIFTFSFPQKQKANYIEIALSDSNLTSYETGVFLKSNNKPKNLVEIESEKLILGNQLFLTFAETDISELLVQFKNENKFSLTCSQLDFYNTTTDSIPEKEPLFAHVITKSYDLKKQVSYKINLPIFNTEKVIVFYKYAKPGNSISKEKWKAVDTINFNEKFMPEETASYKFLVVYNQSCPLSAIGNFSLSPEVIDSESKTMM